MDREGDRLRADLNTSADRGTSRLRPVLTMAASTIAITVATWPILTLTPDADIDFGIDSSWRAGLHLAAHNNLRFGPDVAFPYGPLGFLDSPQLFFSDTGIFAAAYTLAVHLILVGTVFHLVARRAGYLWAATTAFAFGSVAVFDEPELVPVLFFLVAMTSLARTSSLRRTSALVLVGSAVAALQLLVKFNTGVIVFLMAGLLVFVTRGRRRLALMAAHIGFFGACVCLFWYWSGQSFATFDTWISRAFALAAGYGAMATEIGSATVSYAFTLLVIIAVVWMARKWGLWRTTPHTFVAAGLTLILALDVEKRAFTRHDEWHTAVFYFVCATVLLVAITQRETSRITRIAPIALTILVAMSLPNPSAAFRPTAAKDQLPPLISSSRRASYLESSRASLQSIYGLDARSRELLVGHTVHVDPFQAIAAWAYNFDWRPVPVFQTYSAYTRELDRTNATTLTAPDGPDRVLRRRTPSGFPFAIDGRNPMFESPQYMMNLLCHFRELRTHGQWEILGRSTSRCGPPRRIGSSRASKRSLAIPVVGPNQMLVADIHLNRSFLDRLLGFAFKPRSSFIELKFGDRWRRYRLVTATARGPLVLCVPTTAGFSPLFVQTRCPEDIRLVDAVVDRVSFSAVSMNP